MKSQLHKPVYFVQNGTLKRLCSLAPFTFFRVFSCPFPTFPGSPHFLSIQLRGLEDPCARQYHTLFWLLPVHEVPSPLLIYTFTSTKHAVYENKIRFGYGFWGSLAWIQTPEHPRIKFLRGRTPINSHFGCTPLSELRAV